ncbi:TMEM175 family protein [Terriglobus sp. RCC_193]|uniref:TMEM175 family protein n=1 Tax=Terriglobus sp. RCC_193 TaxID=3239218 RepID=UPI0035236F48
MPAHEMKSTRLEAFSDGVIAVIITIMVLELHVPEAHGLPGFLSILPRLGIYALSFLMIAIYWVNHHDVVGRIEVVNYRVLWANLLWLFCVSFVPFFTDYVEEHHFDSFSTALYAGIMLLAGMGFFLLRAAVDNLRKRLGEQIPKADVSEAIKHATSIVLYVAAIPMAFYKPILSLALNLIVTLIWIAPKFGTRHPEGGIRYLNRCD